MVELKRENISVVEELIRKRVKGRRGVSNESSKHYLITISLQFLVKYPFN